MWQEEVSIKFSGYCCQTETGFMLWDMTAKTRDYIITTGIMEK